MLLQFAVENYACFAEKVVLSLLAVPEEAHPEGQTVDVPGIGPVLRSVVLYGPNASGKSTLVRAFEAVRSMAVDGVPPGGKLPVVPHRLDPAWLNAPTTFELEVVADGVHYAYGIRATRDAVAEEWLHRVDGDEDRVIFDRRGGRIAVGDGFDLDPRRRQFYEFVAEGTRPEQPFLAELRSRNATEVAGASDVLASSRVAAADYSLDPWQLVRVLLRLPAQRESFATLLRDMDTGVRDIRLVADSPAVQHRIDDHDQLDVEESVALAKSGSVRVEFLHGDARGGLTPLDIDELSDGTRRLILSVIPTVLMPAPVRPISWLDELDRSFHTELTRHLVDVLNRRAESSQFVFTTHDTNLLDGDVLGRDAIWFVSKDDAGAARLYSLVEFDRAQLDALHGRVEDGYLRGRFGALPNLPGTAPRVRRTAG